MGREAREKALEYDWDILMKQYLKIYEFVKNAVLWEGEAGSGEPRSQEPSEKAFIANKLVFHSPREWNRSGRSSV
jgi:hypothetical protein